MLVLTDNATAAIRRLVDGASLPESGGLRIASTPDGQDSLTVKAATTPETGDQVVEEGGARVFLEDGAATLLDNTVLDARLDDRGNVEFLLAPQGAGPA
ncbi:MAG: Fe-S cluster assembly protein HesB [Actinomycetota bacterium]